MLLAMDGLIVVDDRGVPRVAGSRIRVEDIVLEQRAQRWSAEQIQEQHPHLTLAQIHGALAYYHTHQSEVDARIDRGLEEVDELRRIAGESPWTISR